MSIMSIGTAESSQVLQRGYIIVLSLALAIKLCILLCRCIVLLQIRVSYIFKLWNNI